MGLESCFFTVRDEPFPEPTDDVREFVLDTFGLRAKLCLTSLTRFTLMLPSVFRSMEKVTDFGGIIRPIKILHFKFFDWLIFSGRHDAHHDDVAHVARHIELSERVGIS
jgi:hypothetical protein